MTVRGQSPRASTDQSQKKEIKFRLDPEVSSCSNRSLLPPMKTSRIRIFCTLVSAYSSCWIQMRTFGKSIIWLSRPVGTPALENMPPSPSGLVQISRANSSLLILAGDRPIRDRKNYRSCEFTNFSHSSTMHCKCLLTEIRHWKMCRDQVCER